MGFPRKDDMRLYREPRGGTYLLAIMSDTSKRGHIGAVANALEGKGRPFSLCYTTVDAEFLRRSRRVEWSELPEEWQAEFRRYMDPGFDGGPPFIPAKIRGFWRVENFPGTNPERVPG